MLTMITFWITYGLLTLIWWGFIVYWMFPLVDKLIENWTDGDYKNLLSYKFRNPFLQKFGLMEKTDKRGYLKEDGEWNYMFEGDNSFERENNRWSAVICWWVGIVGLLGCAILTFKSYLEYENGLAPDHGLHHITIQMSNFLVEHISTPILLLVGLLLLNGIIKKVYKFGKRAKIVMDKIEEKS
jgi:hypothetical protein